MTKAKIVVRLKDGVLDPQGQTIRRSLHKMGYESVAGLRQGKYFEVEVNGAQDEKRIREMLEQIASEVLCNPITETFEIEDIS